MRNQRFGRAIEICNRILSKFGPDTLTFMLRGISKCRIQAVSLGKLDFDRAIAEGRQVEYCGNEKSLAFYNAALTQQYVENGKLDQSCNLITNGESIIKVRFLSKYV